MTARELRIGNYINPKFPMQVVNIFPDEVNADFEGNEGDVFEFKNKDLEGIPIDEEWLLKLGFKSGNEYINTQGQWTKNKFGLIQCKWDEEKDSFNLFRTPNGDLQYFRHGKIPLIEYVHQLQNLYFNLTGEELE